MVVKKGNAEERFAIYGGVVDVRPDKVVVLADTAESSFAIDTEKAEAARQRAAQMLTQGVAPEMNREAILALRRAELQLRLGRKMSSGTAGKLRIISEDDDAKK